jgi:hypothetical protein
MDHLIDAHKPPFKLVTGQHIAHVQRTKHERAFLAADLHIGRFILVHPTILQSAAHWRVNPAYVHVALRKDTEERERILAGLDPMVASPMRTVSAPPVVVTDDELIGLAHRVGPDRWLAAGATAGI